MAGALYAKVHIPSIVDIYPQFSGWLNKIIRDNAAKPRFSVWQEAENERLEMLNAETLTQKDGNILEQVRITPFY